MYVTNQNQSHVRKHRAKTEHVTRKLKIKVINFLVPLKIYSSIF